jgi:hypothetical protein
MALTQHGTEKLVNNILGKNDIEAILHRLDRLTRYEALMTGVLAFDIVCGLIRHRRVVMGGEQPVPTKVIAHDEHCMSIDIVDKAPADSVLGDLGRFFWCNLDALNSLTCH